MKKKTNIEEAMSSSHHSRKCFNNNKPLYNPVTDRCIQNTYANRNRISSYKSELPTQKKRQSESKTLSKNRKAPEGKAKDFPNKTRKGLDGQKWVSLADKNGRYRWVRGDGEGDAFPIKSKTRVNKSHKFNKLSSATKSQNSSEPKAYLIKLRDFMNVRYGIFNAEIFKTIRSYLLQLEHQSKSYSTVREFMDNELPSKLRERINMYNPPEEPNLNEVLALIGYEILQYVQMQPRSAGHHNKNASDYAAAIEDIKNNKANFSDY